MYLSKEETEETIKLIVHNNYFSTPIKDENDNVKIVWEDKTIHLIRKEIQRYILMVEKDEKKFYAHQEYSDFSELIIYISSHYPELEL